MQVVREHLSLKNPRFECRDVGETQSLTVSVASLAGVPATPVDLQQLEQVAQGEYAHLEPLYRQWNGIVFHKKGETAGLVVAAIKEISELNAEWRDWFEDLEPDELYDFQKHGIAFATIEASGNYFVLYDGKVYYSDHDGGDDEIWGESVEAFFKRALAAPAQFLYDAGCYTRYFDGESTTQFIPEAFSHD